VKPQEKKRSPKEYLKKKWGKQRRTPGKRKGAGATTFRHPTLQKVWNMAKVAGFDSHELLALKKDLDTHQNKINRHRDLHRQLHLEDKEHPTIPKMKEMYKGFKDEQVTFIERVEAEASENGREAHVTRAAAIKPRKIEKILPSKSFPKNKGRGKGKGKVYDKGKVPRKARIVDLRIQKLRDILDKSELPKEDLEEYHKALLEFEMDSHRIAHERRALKKLHVSTREAFKGKGRGKPLPEGFKKISMKNKKLMKGLTELEKNVRDRHKGL
jgi:hypothetical protein